MSFTKKLNPSSQISSDTEWYLRTNTTKSVQERFENRRAVEINNGQVGVREGAGLVGDAFPGGEFTVHMYSPVPATTLKKESHIDMLSLAVEHAFS